VLRHKKHLPIKEKEKTKQESGENLGSLRYLVSRRNNQKDVLKFIRAY